MISLLTETVLAVEKYSDIFCRNGQFLSQEKQSEWPEADKEIFRAHWRDLAIDKVIPWDMNHDVYLQLEAGGLLHVVAARSEGRLVGYHIGILGPHLHYKSAGTMCYEDIYYILPEFRTGGLGAKLFMFTEDNLREIGVTKWFLACKVHQDHSELFKGLGFRLQDYGFSKLLEAKE